MSDRNSREISLTVIFAVFVFQWLSVTAFAQGEGAYPYSRLDPKPYDPGIDPDIDLFISSWIESVPRTIHGAIVERDILTPCAGNPMIPVRKGAVLKYLSGISYGTLYGHASSAPSILKSEQEIFYIVSGQGVIEAGKTTAELRRGIFVLIPSALTFTIKNTGDDPMTMYIIREPVPDGFRPNSELLVVNEDDLPMGSRAHWSHLAKSIFSTKDGLGTLQSMYVVYFDPMTMGQPHSHVEGCEEIWITVEGPNIILLGKELRAQPPGTVFKIPPNGTTPHSSINTTNKPIKMICFARYGDHEVRK